MCGIAGILNTSGAPVSIEQLEAMTSALRHRGPDGSGIKLFGHAGIAHTRLAIIDVQGGTQPMPNEDKTVWITYNGELYNFMKLRERLDAKGHIFKTNSDTEVIIHAYEEWGPGCVEHFRGMFAFAIVDTKSGQLFLARDQLGIKPLYYSNLPNRFAFSSELQALQCISSYRLDIDLAAIDQYLALQYIPAPRTGFKQINKLMPAHRMTVSFDGKISDPKQYWEIEFRPDTKPSPAEWVEAIDEVLAESVQAHLVADVQYGAFLSGGVDSSAVLAYMSRFVNKPVLAFCIGFEEEDYNELEFAKVAARRWGANLMVETVTPKALEILPKLVSHYGEPFGDSSAIPTYYVCQMARKSVPMVLSGDGGDEMFAGYNSYRSWMRWLAHKDLAFWKRPLRELANWMMPHRYPTREANLDSWLRFIQYFPPPLRNSLWRPEYQQFIKERPDKLEHEFLKTHGLSPCHRAQFMDLKTYLPYDILPKVDVASMFHGLEVRTPIVDIKVLELIATIPDYLNIVSARDGTLQGKSLLKKTMEKYYPSDFLHRPKKGFAVPIERWISNEKVFESYLREHILATNSHLNCFFDSKIISELVDKKYSDCLWLLIVLEEWLKQNNFT